MSKMAEIDQTIKDLRDAAATINDAADWLYQQFSGVEEPEAPIKKQSEPKRKLKLKDVMPVLANLSRAGHTAEVRALLKKYGAAKLSLVDPANYEALLKNAEVIANGS
ncbi:DNA ligase [Clostridium fermenticellae]|uniref:DNA ligase n=1 Tax=Clostridium fermenticellae TaxID=2068654 RepID=A0A386H155_9CLOT|nr:DNA ligase [Clostridium fermenticellae]AYD39421.1 DNA ligase [Clostridium fermenticellae]